MKRKKVILGTLFISIYLVISSNSMTAHGEVAVQVVEEYVESYNSTVLLETSLVNKVEPAIELPTVEIDIGSILEEVEDTEIELGKEVVEESVEKKLCLDLVYEETYIKNEYVDMIFEICKGYENVSPFLIIAQVEAESSGRSKVVSSVNAVGLMQIREKYFKDAMERLGVTDLFDPYSNLLVGIDYMSTLLSKYDVKLALMCYNEGEYGNAKTKAAEGRYSYYSRSIEERSLLFESLVIYE